MVVAAKLKRKNEKAIKKIKPKKISCRKLFRFVYNLTYIVRDAPHVECALYYIQENLKKNSNDRENLTKLKPCLKQCLRKTCKYKLYERKNNQTNKDKNAPINAVYSNHSQSQHGLTDTRPITSRLH